MRTIPTQMKHEKFSYQSREEIKAKAEELLLGRGEWAMYEEAIDKDEYRKLMDAILELSGFGDPLEDEVKN